MAEGRSNAGIAEQLVLTVGAVEKHIASIFAKLRLPPVRQRPPPRARRARLPSGRGRFMSRRVDGGSAEAPAPPVPEQQPGSVVLVRHGETEWSRSGRHTGRTDIPLTELGRREAKAVGEELGGRRFALVLTSPLDRARETCRVAGTAPWPRSAAT